MNTLPPFIRILIRLLLGLNGYILSIAGFLVTVGVALGLAHDPGWVWPGGLLTFIASVAVGIVGFLMVAAADVLTGVRYRGSPPIRIAVIVSTELATMTFAILSASSLLGTLVSAQSRSLSWGWPLFSLLSVSGFAATLRFKRAKKGRETRNNPYPSGR